MNWKAGEADDLIGTIAGQCERAGWDCVIVTGDKDSFQLVTEKTHVRHVKTRMGQSETKEYDVPAFEEEYGFEPHKMVDLKALMGDPSDNIPGVAGVGEKTALDLIRRFGTVEQIYTHLETIDIKDGVRKKLLAGREAARMSYDLATIACDAPIRFEPEENQMKPVNKDALAELFRQLEFHKLMEKFDLKQTETEHAGPSPNDRYKTIRVDTREKAASMLQALSKTPWAALSHEAGFDIVAVRTKETGYLVARDDTPDFEGVLRELFGGGIKKGGACGQRHAAPSS